MSKRLLYTSALTTALLLFNQTIYAANSKNLANLPEAVANNAATQIRVNGDEYLISFSGLALGKTHHDVHNKVFVYQASKNVWKTAKPVPIKKPINGLVGRLASVATAIGPNAYVFGGYTVAADHSEVSVPDVYRFDVVNNQYTELAPMPVPVDDSVALSYQERYIYLISGWHNDGNVNLVQVYDTQTDTWQQASPFPGKPVFGQAGGIVGDTMVICDGVKVDYYPQKRRGFSAEPACYKGKINDKDLTKIHWTTLPHPTGTARYRMAAMGDEASNSIVFIGGSDNPYNYSGIGYNQVPSEPDGTLWRYSLSSNTWQKSKTNTNTMDHRALLKFNNQFITIGGMGENQAVLNTINVYQSR